MANKTNDKNRTMEALNLRLAPDVKDRADALVDHVAEQSGKTATRTDVLREALMRGLRALEKEAGHG